MGLDVKVTASRDLALVRRALAKIGDKGLGKQLAQGLQKAAEPLRPEVRAEAVSVMPSGYGPVLSKALRFRQKVTERHSSAQVTVRVYGDGQKERRDVPSLNYGMLRHPTFGNRKAWVAQKVRRGFVDKPFERLTPEVRRQMNVVIDHVVDQLKG